MWKYYTLAQYALILVALLLTVTSEPPAVLAIVGFAILAASLITSGLMIGLRLFVLFPYPQLVWFAVGLGLTTLLPLLVWLTVVAP